ncbi:MAG: hypothetical protein U0T79_09285 [Ferruginibacter sp.]
MKVAILIVFLITFANPVFSQKYLFKQTGTMEQSSLYIDTVVKSTLRITGKIIFTNLDSSYSDTFNIRRFFAKRYETALLDSIEHFIVVNLTNKPINFRKVNTQLVAEEFSSHPDLGFRPISFFLYPRCGTGIDFSELILAPKEILLIRGSNTRNKSTTSSPLNSFVRLSTSTHGNLISRQYRKAIDKTSFYINADYKFDFTNSSWLLAFKDK